MWHFSLNAIEQVINAEQISKGFKVGLTLHTFSKL